MSEPIKSNGWNLHYLIGDVVAAPVKVGDVVEDFRGDKLVVLGGTPPHKVGSTGRVHTEDADLHSSGEHSPGSQYYPSVIGARWIHDGGGHARD